MKTYTVKSSAVRAAKKAVADTDQTFTVAQDDDGQWFFTIDEVEEQQDDKPRRKSNYIRGVSEVKGPVAMVHAIADSLYEEDENVARKDIMEAAMEAGVTYGTARTQIQKWFEKNRKK